MPLSHEHVESKIPTKIQIYTLIRAELLITLCYETPCTSEEVFSNFYGQEKFKIRISAHCSVRTKQIM